MNFSAPEFGGTKDIVASKSVFTIADFCESMGLPVCMVPDVVEAFQRRELAELAAHEARMQRCAGRPDNEALPLRDEEGNEFGQVEARIPKAFFGNLLARNGFGFEGLVSDDGIRDLLRDNPQCRVKTVSGRITSGWTPGRKTVKNYGRI